MNLYTFSKKSWHVRLFKWIFNEDPTEKYKTMCPYFWTYVLIILFFPLILIIKLFGKFGTKLLVYLKEYKSKLKTKRGVRLNEICKNITTGKEAFKMYNSKKFNRHYWSIDSSLRDAISVLYYDYQFKLEDSRIKTKELKRKKKEERTVKKEKLLKIKAVSITLYVISLILIILSCALLVWGAIELFAITNWKMVGIIAFYVLLYVIAAIIIIFIVAKLVDYVESNNFKLNTERFSWLAKPFKWVFKFFAIIVDMLYSAYKKQCPLITWEE